MRPSRLRYCAVNLESKCSPVGISYNRRVVSSGVSGTFVSSVVYFVVTDGLDSLHNRCLAAAQARVRMLALAGLTNDNVLVRKVPIDRNLAGGDGSGLPAVVLSPRRAAMPNTTGTNGLDDVQYDVLIVIFDRDNQEPTFELNLDRHLLWREQIARAFRNQRLIGVPQIINAAHNKNLTRAIFKIRVHPHKKQ